MKGSDGKRATIKDVADHVGLSATTVSAVLGNRHEDLRISEKTVERVLQAARELGYVPNLAARRLRAHMRSSDQVVLAVITTFEAPLVLVSKAIRGLRMAIDGKRGEDVLYVVTVDMFHAGRLKELPGLLDMSRFNGAIIANTVPEDDEFLASAYIPYPVVLIGRDIPGYSKVCEEDGVGKQACDVLLSVRRSRLAVIHPRMLTQTTAARLNAFVKAVEATPGATVDKIVSDGLNESAGFDAMQAYLRSGGKADGLFTSTDTLAVGACHAIRVNGLTIPDDVAVIGVGDDEAARFIDPPLSTIGVSQAALNEEATKLLLRRLEGKTKKTEELVIPFEPVLRGSTGHKPQA